jgi:hypothetical protein
MKKIEEVLEVRLTRSKDSGYQTELFIRSAFFENYFASLPAAADQQRIRETSAFKGLDRHVIDYATLNRMRELRALSDNWGSESVLQDGYGGKSYSILLAKGLGEGITVPITGNNIVTADFMEEWISGLKKYLSDFYRNYMRRIDMSLRITLEEIQ